MCVTGCSSPEYSAGYQNQNGQSTLELFAVAHFSTTQSFSIPSTVQTIGAASNNGTATSTITQNAIYYIEGQAPPYGATIFNATVYVSAVATASVTLQIGIWVSNMQNSSTPGYGTQAFSLVPQGSYSNVIPISAGPTKFSFTPSIAVHGWTYYIIGVAQTDSGSGTVKLLEGGTTNFYTTTALAVGSLPSQLNLAGASSSSHMPAISAQLLLTPVTINIVNTGGGGGSGTQIINAANPTSVQFWLIPFFYMAVPAAVFIAIASVFKRGGG